MDWATGWLTGGFMGWPWLGLTTGSDCVSSVGASRAGGGGDAWSVSVTWARRRKMAFVGPSTSNTFGLGLGCGWASTTWDHQGKIS